MPALIRIILFLGYLFRNLAEHPAEYLVCKIHQFIHGTADGNDAHIGRRRRPRYPDSCSARAQTRPGSLQVFVDLVTGSRQLPTKNKTT